MTLLSCVSDSQNRSKEEERVKEIRGQYSWSKFLVLGQHKIQEERVQSCGSALSAIGTVQLTGSGREEADVFVKSHSLGVSTPPPRPPEPEKQG